MFGEPFCDYLQKAIPELTKVSIKIGGTSLRLSDYDYTNALIVHNNIIRSTKENIAIFHPDGDLMDVILLVAAGMSSYKESAMKHSGLKIDELKEGNLVEYDCRIARYMGHSTDPKDGIDRFKLIYEDQYKTEITMPVANFFRNVSKYSGGRTTTDKSDSKVRKSDNPREAISALLNVGEQSVGLADYRAFLVCSARPDLIDLLKETEVNGNPFFSIFPSVKCTSGRSFPLRRDLKKRRRIFYFTSSLSAADDVLRKQESIKFFIADGRKVANAGSLLASIKSDYGLEGIYLLEDYSRFDSAYELNKNFGFKIWAWAPSDFHNFQRTNPEQGRPVYASEENGGPAEFLKRIISQRERLQEKFLHHREREIEINYPGLFSREEHSNLIKAVADLRNFNKSRNDPELKAFLIAVYASMYRIFQSPIPDVGTMPLGDSTDILLRDPGTIAALLPSELKDRPAKIIRTLALASNAFKEYYAKAGAIMEIIKGSAKIGILVKRSRFIEPLQSYIAEMRHAQGKGAGNFFIINATGQIDSSFDVLSWTFRPELRQYASAMFAAEESVFLLYGIQQEEMEGIRRANSRMLAPYMNIANRADILKIETSILGKNAPESAAPEDANAVFEDEGLDDLLFTPSSFMHAYGNQAGTDGTVTARQVLFENKFMAFFSKGRRISVLNVEKEGLEIKNVESLKTGDRVVFLKDERRTIFEDLMGYFGHRPEVVSAVEIAESWHKALVDFNSRNNLTSEQLLVVLREGGLDRGIATIENWLRGETILPSDDNAIDVIASVTGDKFLIENKEKVKAAGKSVHGLHIKVGRYLARRITQSTTASDSAPIDPILKQKLNEVSSCAEITEVLAIGTDDLEVPAGLTNRLLAPEDL